MVVDNEEERTYIENYPVFDKHHDESGMIRYLSDSEEKNGVVLG